MSSSIQDIRTFIEHLGISGGDLHDLPTSSRAFPDGAQYRIEIAGVERASTMEALIKESECRNVAIHRVIATVGGATYCDFQELRAMAHMARDYQGLEVIVTIGPRRGWDAGAREAATPEGAMLGFRLRGADNVAYWIADLARALEAGFRGFLVYDEGILFILNQMEREGFIPPETIFKFSVFGGYCSPAGAKVAESLGANA